MIATVYEVKEANGVQLIQVEIDGKILPDQGFYRADDFAIPIEEDTLLIHAVILARCSQQNLQALLSRDENS